MKDRTDRRLPVILGPTASGKSDLAVKVAREFDGEVVSADSMQVYRGMDIGTGKLTREEMAGVPHHLIDVADPDEQFDASMFQRLADEAIAEIVGRGRQPLVAGGTGLYVKALLGGLFEAGPRDPDLRDRLRKEAEEVGRPALHARLAELDPDAAATIQPNDLVRIVRALEVFELTGEQFSTLVRRHGHEEQRYRALMVGLELPRVALHQRINGRVEEMFEGGWIEEVQALRARGYAPELRPMRAIGYLQVNRLLDREIPREEAIALTQRDTRRYARRQMTWLRKEQVTWFDDPSAALEWVLKHR